MIEVGNSLTHSLTHSLGVATAHAVVRVKRVNLKSGVLAANTPLDARITYLDYEGHPQPIA